jgi:3-oxoadipate enol-lactonase/4-carboxymuconolactone decarboxylase
VRPGLDRRTRGAVTLATFVATGRLKGLPSQVLVAVDNGLSVEEILEVLLQSAVYCAAPIANEAFETLGSARQLRW